MVVPGQIQADKEESIEVDTDHYHVTFSNRGAVVRSWILKGYKDTKGKPAGKYSVLEDVLNWATNIGYPGYANAAIDEIYQKWIVPVM